MKYNIVGNVGFTRNTATHTRTYLFIPIDDLAANLDETYDTAVTKIKTANLEVRIVASHGDDPATMHWFTTSFALIKTKKGGFQTNSSVLPSIKCTEWDMLYLSPNEEFHVEIISKAQMCKPTLGFVALDDWYGATQKSFSIKQALQAEVDKRLKYADDSLIHDELKLAVQIDALSDTATTYTMYYQVEILCDYKEKPKTSIYKVV